MAARDTPTARPPAATGWGRLDAIEPSGRWKRARIATPQKLPQASVEVVFTSKDPRRDE